MSGEFDYTPEPAPRHGRAYRTRVAIYDPDAPQGRRYRTLPNVQVETIQYREGAEPPTARFRYVLDDRGRALGWPTQYETILRAHREERPDAGEPSPEKARRYIVGADERIVVLGLAGESEDSDKPVVLFDGFAQSPQVDLSGGSQNVTFVASGVAIRLWDKPITRRLMMRREGFANEESEADWINLPTVFNPSSSNDPIPVGNRAMKEVSNGGREGQKFYPFTDDLRKRGEGVNRWMLSQIAKYLMGAHNADEEFVENPDFAVLEDLLESRRPKEGEEFYDPGLEETYDAEPIFVPEFDATGACWPDALNAQLSMHGFAMAFRCEDDGSGEPWNHLEIYRKDGAGPREPKSIPQQQSGSRLDPARNAVGSISITRDYQAAFNAVTTLCPPARFEIAVVLAPKFLIRPGDEAASVVTRYLLGSLRPNVAPETWDAYRLWVGCEIATQVSLASDGSYDENKLTLQTLRLPWMDVAEAPDAWPRARPGAPWLITTGSNGERLRARLEISFDYKGEVGVLFDPDGPPSTWREIPWGRDWTLLEDRLGVRLTCDNPNAWNIGESSEDQKDARVVKCVKALAAPNDANPPFFLRLTTVIDGDTGVNWGEDAYDRRESSLLKHSRHRWLNVGATFRNEFIHVSSSLLASDDREKAKDGLFLARDDQARLDAYAAQVRADGENPPVSGRIVIPWITKAYEVGDQIETVSGRNLSLTTNAGTEQGEAPRRPYVVGVDWTFSGGGQSTIIHISDRRAEPRPGWR